MLSFLTPDMGGYISDWTLKLHVLEIIKLLVQDVNHFSHFGFFSFSKYCSEHILISHPSFYLIETSGVWNSDHMRIPIRLKHTRTVGPYVSTTYGPDRTRTVWIPVWSAKTIITLANRKRLDSIKPSLV